MLTESCFFNPLDKGDVNVPKVNKIHRELGYRGNIDAGKALFFTDQTDFYYCILLYNGYI